MSRDDLTPLENLRPEHRLSQQETRLSRDNIGVPLTDTGKLRLRRKEAVKQLEEAYQTIRLLPKGIETSETEFKNALHAIKAVQEQEMRGNIERLEQAAKGLTERANQLLECTETMSTASTSTLVDDSKSTASTSTLVDNSMPKAPVGENGKPDNKALRQLLDRLPGPQKFTEQMIDNWSRNVQLSFRAELPSDTYNALFAAILDNNNIDYDDNHAVPEGAPGTDNNPNPIITQITNDVAYAELFADRVNRVDAIDRVNRSARVRADFETAYAELFAANRNDHDAAVSIDASPTDIYNFIVSTRNLYFARSALSIANTAGASARVFIANRNDIPDDLNVFHNAFTSFRNNTESAAKDFYNAETAEDVFARINVLDVSDAGAEVVSRFRDALDARYDDDDIITDIRSFTAYITDFISALGAVDAHTSDTASDHTVRATTNAGVGDDHDGDASTSARTDHDSAHDTTGTPAAIDNAAPDNAPTVTGNASTSNTAPVGTFTILDGSIHNTLLEDLAAFRARANTARTTDRNTTRGDNRGA